MRMLLNMDKNDFSFIINLNHDVFNLPLFGLRAHLMLVQY